MALRKRGGTFLICFRMRYPEKGGSLRKGGFQPWRKLWTTEKLCKPRGHEHKNPMLPVLQAVCSQCYQCYKQCVVVIMSALRTQLHI